MKKISSALAFLLTFGAVTPSVAMENGESALGNERIISTQLRGTSAFLYDDQIIFTNAHSVYDREGHLLPLDSYQILSPGALTYSKQPKVKVVKVFIASGYKDWNGRTEWARTNDFAILVLDKPVANVKKAELVGKAEMEALRAEGAMVTTGGYGFQSLQDRNTDYSNTPRIVEPKKATLAMASGDYLAPAIAKVQSVMDHTKTRGSYPEDLRFHLLSPYGGPGTCDGDSGSGFFIEEGSTTKYLGTIGGHVGITNCGVEQEIPGFTPLIGISPVYQYLDLIQEAEDWLLANSTKPQYKVYQKTLSSFGATATTLSSQQKAQVKAAVDANPNAEKFICTGIRYYSQPMSVNIMVRKRAKAACEYAKQLNPNLSTWYQNKPTKARSYAGKVLLTLKNPNY